MINSINRRTAFLSQRIPSTAWPYVAVLFLIAVGTIISRGFASPDHLLSILNLAAFLGLVAAGQGLVILSGGIDLSVNSVISLSSVVSAALMAGANQHFLPGALVCIVLGLIIGFLNGVGVAFIKIHPLVMTLGMTNIVQGATLLYTKGVPKGNAAPLLSELATGRLWGVVPYVVLLWAAIAAVIILSTRRSVWGRRIYAVGNSPTASYYSGIRVPWVLVSLYLVSSLLATLAGLLLTGYTRTSYFNIGDPFQMNSIAAVVLGGSSILGGFGSYVGTIAGCIIMILIQAILPILSIPEAGRQISSGVIILALLLLYGHERARR